jgi:GNAT superfamily N-acetyltransferase
MVDASRGRRARPVMLCVRRSSTPMADLKDSEIRRIFLPEDTEQIRRMQAEVRVFSEHYPEHRRWLDITLREVIQGKRIAFGVYRSGIDDRRRLTFELVGSIILKLNHFTGIVELKNLFVREDARGKGYGTALYRKIDDYCTKAGFVGIETEVPVSEQGTVTLGLWELPWGTPIYCGH